ncbi:MAG: lipopolysaccharide biosynthesis protein [Chitinispirillales bacterium]|jgi:PST family polysaccharide transporter|nr:lipopolysaccharide biosynthesis protein [Chitinispirillales bacterium]
MGVSLFKTVRSRKKNEREKIFETAHLKGNLKSRAIKGGSVVIFARTVDFAAHTVGTIVLARLLLPADFGLLAMVLTITGFFVLFKDLGLSDATVQSEKINHKQVSTLFWINVFFSLLIISLIVLMSPLAARFYNEPRLAKIITISAMSFVFAGFSTQHLALLKRNMKFVQIATVEIVAALVSITAALIMAFNGFGYWALVARPIILAVLTMAGVWFFCPWRPGLPVRRSGVRGLIGFGAGTMGFYLVNYFARNVDKALIGWAKGAVALGFYHKAYHLFILPVSQFSIPLQSVAVTTLTKLRNEPDRYKEYFIKAIALISFAGMPMSTYLAALGRDIIILLLGENWLGAADIFAVLGLGAGMQIIYATQGWLHVSLGRSDRWFFWGCINSAIMILFFVAGLPFGAVGVAAGYTVSLYILTAPALWYAGRPVKLGLGEIIRAVWKIYLAAAFAGLLTWVMVKLCADMNIFYRLSLCSVFFAAAYLSSIVILSKSFEPLVRYWKLFLFFKPGKKVQESVPE